MSWWDFHKQETFVESQESGGKLVSILQNALDIQVASKKYMFVA